METIYYSSLMLSWAIYNGDNSRWNVRDDPEIVEIGGKKKFVINTSRVLRLEWDKL